MKIILYFIQSLIVYIFFLISKIIGLKLSRLLFSYIFKQFGSIFRSKKIIFKNLEIINSNISTDEKKRYLKKCGQITENFLSNMSSKRFKKKSNTLKLKIKNFFDFKSKKACNFISAILQIMN